MSLTIFSDESFMKEALKEAQKAFAKDEVPIGAVVVCKERIIARGHNMSRILKDVTAHAEMIAFTSASSFLNSKYLLECTLYVTLEPCIMCAGAAFWTQIPRIYFGAYDPKRGYQRCNFPILHPSTKIQGGILEHECSQLMKDFFELKRD